MAIPNILQPLLNKRFIITFVLDIIYCVVVAIIGFVFKAIKPYSGMEIPLGKDNPTVLYPYIPSTVPYWLCCLIAYLFTFIIIIIFEIKRRDLKHFVVCCVSFFASAVTVLTIIEAAKKFAGRPRPDYWERVGKEPDDSIVSFPSGHSGTIFNGMTFLSLFLAGELKIFSKKYELWRSMLNLEFILRIIV